MEARTRGIALLALAVAVVVVAFGASAALATDERAGTARDGTLVGVHGGGVGLHQFGRVARFDGTGERQYAVANADSYFDVTAREDGTILAGFMNGDATDCGSYEPPCARTGFRVLDPDAADPIVYQYAYPVRTEKNSETHDVEQLPSGNFLVTDMDAERITVVARNDSAPTNGTVVWQWQAREFYEAPPDPTRTDWLHINDVDRIGDGRYLVSVRNANQLVVVERGAGVVEVINEDDPATPESECTQFGRLTDADGDGNVRCGDPDLFDEQHNPQWLGPDAVLIADSGNDRIVELHRTDGEWTVAWSLTSANDRAFAWPRDADRLPSGTTLVTDSANGRVVEVDADGETVWVTTMANRHFPYEAERLPVGETVGAPRYENGTVARSHATIPVLTSTLSILRTSLALPFWVSEGHLLAVAGAIVLAAGGVASLVQARRAGASTAE